MKAKHLIAATLIGSLIAGNAAMAAPRAKTTSTTTTTLVASEIAMLQFMREEEKLARDVYRTLDQYWGTQTAVFANIAVSEQQHTDTIDALLDKYNLEDPVVQDVTGMFNNVELQELYDLLVAKGTKSLVDGLYVGALIEETDIEDIVDAIEGTDERATIIAYSNLLDGSKNHLRAFVDVIGKQGLSYDAQVLTDAEVQSILDAQ